MADGYTNRDMSGALFKNDKGDNQARPDYRGDITINGVTHKLAAWIKEGRNGSKFMSLRVEVPRDDPHSRPPSQPGPRSVGSAMPPAARNAARTGNDLDDEIPF